MTSSIYLVRHGQVHNPNRIIYGRLPNISLSDEGKTSIEETANFLKAEHIKEVFTSPLLRTQQSAQIISLALNLPETLQSLKLLEICSSLEGLPIETIAKTKFNYYFSKNRKEDDETMEEIFKRMKKFIDNTFKLYLSENTVAVSHGDPIMILLTGLTGLPFELDSIRTKNYIQYGEVVKISLENSNYVIERVFKPNSY